MATELRRITYNIHPETWTEGENDKGFTELQHLLEEGWQIVGGPTPALWHSDVSDHQVRSMHVLVMKKG